ncbi:MAG: hypothetical protein APF77_13210 [Clostridia bacterium BRH_c25]|nr:MAG: hypothetical protein APF77_13210 [Clostridia bacterium BRH_c25]
MKNVKKAAALIIVMCMVIGALSGCTPATEGKALYDAMIKSQSIKSSQNDVEFTLRLDAAGISEQDKAAFEQMKAVLNGAELSMNMKQSANTDNTAAKAEVDMIMNMGGMSMDMGVWVDMDLNGDSPKFKEIIKLPAMMTATNPAMAGKEYMVMDIGETMKGSEVDGQVSDMDYAETMKLTKEFQEKATAFMAKYLAQYDPGFKFISDAGTKEMITPERTVKAHVYQVKLNDKTAKKLVRYTVNNFADNKDAMDFAVEYMKLIQKFTVPTPGAVSPTAEFEKFIAGFENEKPEMLAEFNKAMDQLESIQLIGDNGITLEYAIDENGYIISQSGSMDFIIDVAKLDSIESIGNSEPAGVGIYTVGFDFSMLSYNINKDMTIEMPVVTPENSIDFNNMANAAIPEQPVQPAPPIQ